MHRILLVAVLACQCWPALAQSTRKTGSRPANVQMGTVVVLGPAATTLTIRLKTGQEVTYRLTESTQFLKAKKRAEPTAFASGDTVVVRYRRSKEGPASLYDVADRASWDWLSRIRREPTLITLTAVAEDGISGTEGPDSTAVSYRVTDRTTWEKAGKTCASSDFKVGDQACVVPRMLPSGGIMALAVSDSPSGAARLKERARSVVTATLKALDSAKKTITFHTPAGDDRELPLASDCRVRAGSRDVTLASLRPGQTVAIHTSRDEVGDQVVTRITIQAKKTVRRALPTKAKPR